MFDQIPDLSPDLEWMLGSRQASDQAIIEALLKEYYSEIRRLSAAILSDPEAIRGAVVDTFASALLRVEDFRGEEGVRTWLLRIAVQTGRKHNSMLKAHASLQVPRLNHRQLPKNGHKIYQDDFQGEIWQAIDSLPEPSRLSLILKSVQDLPVKQISQVLQVEEQKVEAQLESAQRQVRDRLGMGKLLEGVLRGERLESYLARSLKGRWPPIDPAAGELENLAGEIEVLIQQKRRDRLRIMRMKELALLFTAILVVAGVLRAAFLLSQDDKLAPPLNPTPRRIRPTPVSRAEKPATVATAIPFQTLVPLSDFTTPLTAKSDPRVIQLRMRQDPSWDTLWADVNTYFYGPVGYVGPPRVYRDQIWISLKEHRGLLLTGMNLLRPERSIYYDQFTNPSGGAFFFSTYSEIEQLGLPLPWASLQSDVYPFGLRITELLWLYNSRYSENPNWRVVGTEEVLGREALVLKQSDESGSWTELFWIDTSNGLLLREQLFKDSTILVESVVTGVAFDVDFPQQRIFADWRKNLPPVYASSYRGDIEMVGGENPLAELKPPLARRTGVNTHPYWPAPSGLDFAHTSLTFQSVAERGNRFVPIKRAALFAGGFYLGSLEIGDPFNVACTRSPDGATIAYADYSFVGSEPLQSLRTTLHWVRLDDLESVQTAFDQTNIWGFEFSPDSKRLAVSGIIPQEEKSFVNIINLENGENKKIWGGNITSAGTVLQLVWLSDRDALALIEDSKSGREAIIVDPRTGQEFNRIPIDFSSEQLMFGPVPIKVDIGDGRTIELDSYRMRSLQDCTKAPGQD